MKRRGLTRRQVGTAAIAMPALAQKSPGEVDAARAQVRENGAALRKFRISTALEPSFVFKA
jgi:hypothetical protein